MKIFLLFVCLSTGVFAKPGRLPRNEEVCLGQADGRRFPTSNCNSFYVCEEGRGHLNTCDFGLLFSAELEVCDWADNVHCFEIEGPPQGVAPDCTGKDGSYLPNPYDCHSYYICEHGAALWHYCANGLLFDESIENCNWEESVTCTPELLPTEPTAIDCTDKDWEYLVNPENCGTYYRCENDIAIMYTCDQGLLFDPIMLTCNWAQSVNCNAEPIQHNIDCTDNDFETFPNPNDCGSYYRCEKNTPILYRCAHGLYYDVVEQSCNWAESVNCDNRK